MAGGFARSRDRSGRDADRSACGSPHRRTPPRVGHGRTSRGGRDSCQRGKSIPALAGYVRPARERAASADEAAAIIPSSGPSDGSPPIDCRCRAANGPSLAARAARRPRSLGAAGVDRARPCSSAEYRPAAHRRDDRYGGRGYTDRRCRQVGAVARSRPTGSVQIEGLACRPCGQRVCRRATPLLDRRTGGGHRRCRTR